MSSDNGSPEDMSLLSSLRRRLLIDEGTADRLVSGAMAPDDAPPPYADVARVLADASAPAQPHEIEHEAAAVAMFVAERSQAVDVADRRVPRALRYSMRTMAVAAVGALLLTGGVAAAATGHLPDAVQGPAHDTLRHIGVSIPAPPADSNHGQDVKTTATDPSTSGEDHGQAVCTVASDGKCMPGREGENGNPSEPSDSSNGRSPNSPAIPPGQEGQEQGPPASVPGDAHKKDPGTTTTTTTHPGNGPPTSPPGRSGDAPAKANGKS